MEVVFLLKEEKLLYKLEHRNMPTTPHLHCITSCIMLPCLVHSCFLEKGSSYDVKIQAYHIKGALAISQMTCGVTYSNRVGKVKYRG